MAQIEIPERYRTAFVSQLPGEDTIADVSSNPTLYPRAFTANTVSWAQFEGARVLGQIGVPGDEIGAAQQFLGYAFQPGQVQTFAPDAIRKVVGDWSSLATTLGVFESAPIIGWIMAAGIAVYDMARSAWIYKNTKATDAEALAYSKTADEFQQAQMLVETAAPDQIALFSPINDAAGGVEAFKVELTAGMFGEATKVKRRYYVPQGTYQGLGVCPGTDRTPRGWQWDTETNARTRNGGMPWAAFRPGSQAAGIATWNGMLANTRRAYLVDSKALAGRWETFWGNMETWAYGDRYGKTTRYRLQWALNPAQGMGGQYSAGVLRSIPRAYWSQLDGLDGSTRQGGALYQADGRALTMRGVTRWIIDTKLRRRQHRNLGTLTCAYVSENDPAFADLVMRTRLHAMRKALLSSPARRDVELDRVVDPGYRQALWSSRMDLAAPAAPKPKIKRGAAAPIPKLPGGKDGDAPTAPDPLVPSQSSGLATAAIGGGLAWLVLGL